MLSWTYLRILFVICVNPKVHSIADISLLWTSADSPFDEQLDQEAVKLINEGDILVNQITKGYPQPSQENVVRCTEQITKKIQELLLAAQAGRHSWLVYEP